MFRISVTIDALDRNGRKVDGITMSYKDFLTLKEILGKKEAGEEAERKTEIDLSAVEQEALINELLKRPGVDNEIMLLR